MVSTVTLPQYRFLSAVRRLGGQCETSDLIESLRTNGFTGRRESVWKMGAKLRESGLVSVDSIEARNTRGAVYRRNRYRLTDDGTKALAATAAAWEHASAG